MKIQTGMKRKGDAKPIDGNRVDFITTADDRIMFSVSIGKDGRSLEIQACDTCMVDGVVYDTSILVKPNAANLITVSTKPYNA